MKHFAIANKKKHHSVFWQLPPPTPSRPHQLPEPTPCAAKQAGGFFSVLSPAEDSANSEEKSGRSQQVELAPCEWQAISQAQRDGLTVLQSHPPTSSQQLLCDSFIKIRQDSLEDEQGVELGTRPQLPPQLILEQLLETPNIVEVDPDGAVRQSPQRRSPPEEPSLQHPPLHLHHLWQIDLDHLLDPLHAEHARVKPRANHHHPRPRPRPRPRPLVLPQNHVALAAQEGRSHRHILVVQPREQEADRPPNDPA
eukprot:757628-Hanusia_phi.AAC.4